MADNNKIKEDDIFQKGGSFFDDIKKGAEEYATALQGLNLAYEEIIIKSAQLAESNPFETKQTAKNVKDLNAAIMSGTQAMIQQTKVQKELFAAEQQREKLEQQRIKTSQQKSKAEQQYNKEIEKTEKNARAVAKATAQAESAYYKLSQQLINQKKAVKDLLASNKELTDHDKELIKNTQELDRRLKEIDATVGDNQRNVGAYREALNDVTAEMGAFGGIITRIARTLKTLQEQQEHTTTGLKKIGNVLKAVGIGIALALIAAVVEANKAANEMSEALQRASDKFDVYNVLTGKGAEITLAYAKSVKGPLNSSLSEALDAYSKLIDITISYEAQMRVLRLEQQKLTIEQDEFNQVANDTTIGYDERIKAQKEVISLSEEIATKNKEIATAELNFVQAQIKTAEKTVGQGNANKELKDKLLEAQLKLNDANAQEALLVKENATKVRQIISDQTLLEIDLILKKKDAANEEKALLEQSLKDQKTQLEQRKIIADQLLAVEKKTTDKELEIFKKGFQVRFENNNLLKEQDAVVLAQKIKNLRTLEGHGLGDAAQLELAKIVKQYQEDQITNTKTQIDLDQELIKRKQKIAETEKEIALLGLQDKAGDFQKLAEQKQNSVEETNKQILEKGKLFSVKTNRQRKQDLQSLEGVLIDQNSSQVDALKAQADLDKLKAKNSIDDEKLRAEEIKKIDTKLAIDLENLQDDFRKKDEDFNKKRIEDTKKIEQARASAIIQSEQDILAAIDDGLKQRNERQKEASDFQITETRRAIDEQFALAAQGKANTLAFERAELNKEELARKEALKKQQREEEAIKLSETFLNDLNAKLAKDVPFGQAVSEAIAETFAAKGISGLIAGNFIEGTENVGRDLKKNKVHNGQDGYVIGVDGDERIFKPGHNRLLGDMSNEEVVRRALLPDYSLGSVPASSTAENMANSYAFHQFNKYLPYLEKIAEKPDTVVHLDNLGQIIKEQTSKGITNRFKYAKQTTAGLR